MAVVIPVLDEAAHLPHLLADLESQDMPSSDYDVLVLDGGSTDGTRALLDAHQPANGHAFCVIENPDRTVPYARNLAMRHLSDDVELLVELIGHLRIEADHLSSRRRAWVAGVDRHSEALVAMGVRVLGPTTPSSTVEGWVDGALRSPIGRGGGQFASFSEVGRTKVPAFATHRRTSVEAVGGWKTDFATSQDSDLSMRLIDSGGVIERDPTVTVRMHRRTSLVGHWRMAVRYGYWRGRLLRAHPRRADPREFAPMFGAVLCGVLALTVPDFVIYPVLAYLAVLLAAGLGSVVHSSRITASFGVPLCLVMLHTGFTLGLLRSLFSGPPRKRDR